MEMRYYEDMFFECLGIGLGTMLGILVIGATITLLIEAPWLVLGCILTFPALAALGFVVRWIGRKVSNYVHKIHYIND